MPRIMCFDYGTKRVGIAVTYNLQPIATGLCTLHPDKVETLKTIQNKNSRTLFNRLTKKVRQFNQ